MPKVQDHSPADPFRETVPSSGENRHKKRFQEAGLPNLDALRAWAKVTIGTFDLIERVIVYRASLGINELPNPADPIKYVIAIEIRHMPRDPDEIKAAMNVDDALRKTLNQWQPDSMRTLARGHEAVFGNLDQWVVYPCAPGEEIIDVDEEQTWLLFDKKRIIDTQDDSAAKRSDHGSEDQQEDQLTSPRKNDYRKDQWEKAIPIARVLFQRNPLITLPEIKKDRSFVTCFLKGMPSDSRIRDVLNKEGIKLASGKRQSNAL